MSNNREKRPSDEKEQQQIENKRSVRKYSTMAHSRATIIITVRPSIRHHLNAMPLGKENMAVHADNKQQPKRGKEVITRDTANIVERRVDGGFGGCEYNSKLRVRSSSSGSPSSQYQPNTHTHTFISRSFVLLKSSNFTERIRLCCSFVLLHYFADPQPASIVHICGLLWLAKPYREVIQ